MPDWKSELHHIAAEINDRLRRDTFPEFIEPEALRTAVRAYPLMGGKRLRPALVLWACGLFGGNPAAAWPAACAVEIYHNWTLVHDDIIDCDDFRRGVPTTHAGLSNFAKGAYGLTDALAKKFGNDFAILAGDLQQAWSVNAMLGLSKTVSDPELVLYLVRKMQENLGRALISGEACDVAFEVRPSTIPETEVRAMMDGKTGALLRFCMQTGAVIAKNEPDFDAADVRAISDFAGSLAMAFQLRDDWLGVFGDVKTFGKPLCSDFQEGKPTLLYLAAMRRGSDDVQRRLKTLLGLPDYPPETVEAIRALLRESGAEAEIRAEIERSSAHALELLRKFPANEYRDYLEALVLDLTNRNV